MRGSLTSCPLRVQVGVGGPKVTQAAEGGTQLGPCETPQPRHSLLSRAASALSWKSLHPLLPGVAPCPPDLVASQACTQLPGETVPQHTLATEMGGAGTWGPGGAGMSLK